MITNEQIAHDLALVYLVNRYGPEVDGEIEVSDGDGTGSVDTERLPDVGARKTMKVATGERGRFLLWRYDKTAEVDTDEYRVDPVFRRMILDYHEAYSRFLELINTQGVTD